MTNVGSCCLWSAEHDLSLHYGKEQSWSPISSSYNMIKKGSSSPHDNEGKDEVFEAINQVLKFIAYDAEACMKIFGIYDENDKRLWPLLFIYYPVIVFDGELYRGTMTNGKIKLAQANHIILKAQYQPRYASREKTYYIDVVRKDYFSEYFAQIENEADRLREIIHQSSQKFYIDARKRYHQKHS